MTGTFDSSGNVTGVSAKLGKTKGRLGVSEQASKTEVWSLRRGLVGLAGAISGGITDMLTGSSHDSKSMYDQGADLYNKNLGVGVKR